MRVPQTQPAGKTYATNTPGFCGADERVECSVDDCCGLRAGHGESGRLRKSGRGPAAHDTTASATMLEQGESIPPEEIEHDELGVLMLGRWSNDAAVQPQTYRKTEKEKAKSQLYAQYVRVVDESSSHFTANYWRFRPIETDTSGRATGVIYFDRTKNEVV